MNRSKYFEFLAEEEALRLGGQGAFASLDELKMAIAARAGFAIKIKAALDAGEITQEQHDALTTLNRTHGLFGKNAPGI